MGMVAFEGAAPYGPIYVQTATSEPTPDAVKMVLNVVVGEQKGETVPVFVLLEPSVARVLAGQLAVNAGVVERWKD
jgi:hypothetical protein